MAGILYIVPTPIGNLADMTYRGVNVLNEVDLIYSEDTRTSRVLLKHYNINTPQKSYHKFNEKEKCNEIIGYLKNGKNVAVISDAGTPGISDPSNILVKEVLENNLTICPLPGATALIPALVASGFDTQTFYMIGFLPKKKKQRESILDKLKTFQIPLVFYESNHRIVDTLTEFKDFFSDAKVCIAREISKIYETFYRGKLCDILVNITEIVLKGEFVIVVMPRDLSEESNSIYLSDEHVLNLYKNKFKEHKLTQACKLIAEELGCSKKKIYDIIVNNHNPEGVPSEKSKSNQFL